MKYPKENYVPYLERDLKAEDLSVPQFKILAQLNSELAVIGRLIESEMTTLISAGEKRIGDPDDWVEDFEVDGRITFILRKEDPAFNEDDDNILVELAACPFVYLGDELNHNEFQNWDHAMKDEFHCWLYHCLYDHTDLDWINILRIGSIWIDVKIEYQKYTGINIK